MQERKYSTISRILIVCVLGTVFAYLYINLSLEIYILRSQNHIFSTGYLNIYWKYEEKVSYRWNLGDWWEIDINGKLWRQSKDM